MWGTLGLLLIDKEYTWRTAIGLTVLVSAGMCGFAFTVLSFTVASGYRGIDTYQIAAIVSFYIAILALLYVVNLAVGYVVAENAMDGHYCESQFKAVFIRPDETSLEKETLIQHVRKTY